MSHDGKGNVEDVALTSHGAEKGSPELRPQEEECVAGEGGGVEKVIFTWDLSCW